MSSSRPVTCDVRPVLPVRQWEEILPSGYLADTKASDFDILWVNYWAYPGTELQVAEQYAKEHGLGWVIMVRDLPRKQAREDPCKEPTEGSR